MIRSDNHIRTAKLIDNDTDQILDFCDCIITGREYGAVRGMTGLIYLIVVDVNDIHALDQSLTLHTLETNDVVVFQRNTVGIIGFQYLVSVSGICRLSVSQNAKDTVAARNDLQLLMRQQSCHTELRDRREDRFTAVQRYLALHLPLKLLRKGGCHFIAESIRDDHKDTVVVGFDLGLIEVNLLRHFQNATIRLQILSTGIRPVLTELPKIPVRIETFDLLRDMFEKVIQQRIGSLQALLEAEME